MDLSKLKEWGDDALNVVFPMQCEVCGKALTRGERVLCLYCDVDMPRTRLHVDEFNVLHQRLAGKAPIDKATGYFYYYRDSDYAKMIQRAKYNGRPKIVEILAQRYVSELNEDSFFEDIDLIEPVPMHWLKKIRRGYNQSEEIARAISKVTGIKLGRHIVTSQRRSTQTRKGRFERWLNARNAYNVINADELSGRHVLVVDDIITTGATMLACCEAIHEVSPTSRISVLSLGVTHLQ